MGVISALFNSKVYSFEEAFGSKDITTEDMKAAIQDWLNLYFSAGAKEKGEDDCMRIPVVIVNKLTKAMFGEYKVEAKNDFEKRILKVLNDKKSGIMQKLFIGGECFIKPVPTLDKKGFYFVVVRRDCFIPLAENADEELTSVGMAETTTVGGKYYTLLEKRTANGGEHGGLLIENKLYMSTEKGIIGRPVALNSLPQYANLEPETELNRDGLGMVNIRTPLNNTVDDSRDAVAIFAPADEIIHNINTNEEQLKHEFKVGQSKILAPKSMVKKNGNSYSFDNDLFVKLSSDPEDMKPVIFSPEFREQSYHERRNGYLKICENILALKRGILSEVEAVERTATEITSSEGDQNLTIIDLQSIWATAALETIELCEKLGQIYYVPVEHVGENDVTFDFGDGVLFNRDKTWNEYKELVQMGLLKPEIAVAWYFKLPCKTAKELEDIRTNYMPEIQQLAAGEE